MKIIPSKESDLEAYKRKLTLAALAYVYSEKEGDQDIEAATFYLRTSAEAVEAAQKVEKHDLISFSNAIAKVEKVLGITN